MRKVPAFLFLALILPAVATMTPGKVVFQNAYPEKGMESTYNLKSTFTYGVDDELNCRCYYGATLSDWIEEAQRLYPGAKYAGVYHIVDIYLDPKADFGHDENQWWLEIDDPSLDWEQCGGYALLPNEFGDDTYGFETDLNYYGEEGVSGTHKVEYKVVIELVDDWDPLRGEYMWKTDVTISEGSFNWVVP